MIRLKTKDEVEIMKEGGRRLKKVVGYLLPEIKAGKTTLEIDNLADKLIEKNEGKPSFKRVKDYFWSTCLCLNEQIVHTPPSQRIIKNGDILTLDIGMYYRGYHTDFATTVAIGNVDKKTEAFLQSGRDTLNKAIEKFKKGKRLGEVSSLIETKLKRNGFTPVKELTGHGIGRELHEDPSVPGLLMEDIDRSPVIQSGLAVAIEVIYAMGSGKMKYEGRDQWSIVTRDGSLSACFEKTVAVGEEKTFILT